MATHLLAPREALDYHGSIPNGKRYGMMKIRLGFGIGAWPFAERNYRALYDFVDDCESWGVDSLWFSDRIVGKGATLEPIVTIAVLSGRKGMMKFGRVSASLHRQFFQFRQKATTQMPIVTILTSLRVLRFIDTRTTGRNI